MSDGLTWDHLGQIEMTSQTFPQASSQKASHAKHMHTNIEFTLECFPPQKNSFSKIFNLTSS